MFTRDVGGQPQERRITITASGVVETWTVGGEVLEDQPVKPFPDGAGLVDWFSRRHSDLHAQGWRLAGPAPAQAATAS